MIDRLIDLSARNRGVVILLVAAAVVAGWWSMKGLPLDATPDLSETQVIVYSRWDRSPDIIEDQVTYPIVTAMLGAPKVKDVRGFSDFGYSYVYIIFEEGTDLYWARSRTLEYLSKVSSRLPQEVKPELGPDATGVGWVFQYALVDTTGKRSLSELRSLQDWYLRYHLETVPGVAEVAPLGGFVRQYQINVDPNRLQAYGIPITKLVAAVRESNNDVGGRVVELTGREYMVRGRGYAKSVADLENIALTTNSSGVPVTVKDVGEVVLGPEMRRGVADLDGKGETVSGIVVMRQGANALDVIERVKAKIKDIEPGLPTGVKIITAYDRSDLILASIHNLKSILIEELIVVSRRHSDLPVASAERINTDHHDSCHRSSGLHSLAHDGRLAEHNVPSPPSPVGLAASATRRLEQFERDAVVDAQVRRLCALVRAAVDDDRTLGHDWHRSAAHAPRPRRPGVADREAEMHVARIRRAVRQVGSPLDLVLEQLEHASARQVDERGHRSGLRDSRRGCVAVGRSSTVRHRAVTPRNSCQKASA